MELSFAPMEGITSYVYRDVHARLFPGADVYYAPFIAPDGRGNFKTGDLRDVLPENNSRIKLVPQILCNSAHPFLAVVRVLADLGYEEVNLNAGCPSGTVVSKHKGAGMLLDLGSLDNCLAGIFSSCPLRVSVKTRMGMEDSSEFPAILEVYKKYPLSRLIVHARSRSGMYKSRCDTGAFAAALPDCPFPVIYNGDIFSPSQLESLLQLCPGLSGVMLGRGAVTDPALFRRLLGGAELSRDELQCFHDELLNVFLSSGLSPNYAVSRMKELWFYMQHMFPDSGRPVRNILKSRSLADYCSAVRTLFSSCRFDGSLCFSSQAQALHVM